MIWLFLKTNWKWLAGLALLALIFTLFQCQYKQGEEAGATKIEAKAAKETIERVKEAKDVEETFDRDAQRVYDQCLRTARTPANCKRWVPPVQPAER